MGWQGSWREGQNEELFSIAVEIDKNKEYKLREGEKVGFVFPVYAWGPPEIVLRFIRRLKMTKPEYLFFVCTCGDDTGRTAQLFSSAVARKGWRVLPVTRSPCPNTYVSLPGFDVDDEDVETRKVHNAVARVRFINEEIASRVQTKHYNCHEGALPFTKSYFLRPFFNTFLMSPKPFYATEQCIAWKKFEQKWTVKYIDQSYGSSATGDIVRYATFLPHSSIRITSRSVACEILRNRKGQYNGRAAEINNW